MLRTLRFRAMASDNIVCVETADAGPGDAAMQAAMADVLRIEAKYSRYRDDSVTAAINRAAGGQPVPIDAETHALLGYADACWRLSERRFDITSGVYRRAWDFRQRPPRLPQQDEIDALRRLVDWARVEWNERSVRLPRADMQVDFGGIGKEYAADRAATLLIEAGVAGGFVSLGGDVRAIGTQGDGRPWRIGIQHPRRPAPDPIASIDIVDAALATSGDYERCFELEGRRYCHLIDARTGWPVEAWQSISVKGPLAVIAGSLSTIAMLSGPGAGTFLDGQGLPWFGIAADGRAHGTLASV